MGSTGTIRRSRDGVRSGRNGNGVDLINGTMGDLETRGFDIGSQVLNQQITQNSVKMSLMTPLPIPQYREHKSSEATRTRRSCDPLSDKPRSKARKG